MVRLKKFQSTPPLFGLSSFLQLSFRDFGCGKAMSFDDYFEKIGLTRRYSEPPTSSAIYGYAKFEPQHCVLNAHRPAVAELER